MIGKLSEETQIMRTWSNSSALLFIDFVAIAIAQGYMLTRARLAPHPSPVLRLAAARDAAVWDVALLERELAVFRQERERIPAKQRPYYTPTHRLEILQIMRLREWSATKTATRFALHPNTVRSWIRQLRTAGKSGHLFTSPVCNRLHDAVRWTVHELLLRCIPNGTSEPFSLHVPWHSMRYADVAHRHYAAQNQDWAFQVPGTADHGRRRQAHLSTYEIGECAIAVL